MRISVDWNSCESNALCTGAAPEVFELDDNDMLNILIEEPGEALRAKVQEAVSLCPKQAISVTD